MRIQDYMKEQSHRGNYLTNKEAAQGSYTTGRLTWHRWDKSGCGQTVTVEGKEQGQKVWWRKNKKFNRKHRQGDLISNTRSKDRCGQSMKSCHVLYLFFDRYTFNWSSWCDFWRIGFQSQTLELSCFTALQYQSMIPSLFFQFFFFVSCVTQARMTECIEIETEQGALTIPDNTII